MQKSETRQAKTAHRQIGASSTLNRKYVARPTKMTDDTTLPVQFKTQKQDTSPKITHFNGVVNTKATKKDTEDITPAEKHPTQVIANQKLRERKEREAARKQIPNKLTAKELKDQAIKKALATASTTTATEGTMAQITTKEQKKETRMRFGFGRIMLALTCATAAVFAIVYFVSLNMPDVQFRATAAQLQATYPNYLPRNYYPIEIASENQAVTLSFENYTTKESFSIAEEKSSWDSNSLLNNFVKENYGEDYTVVREQGLTIYIGNNKATWVNGGVVYKLNVKKGSLTKKQISSIAVSF